jgi:hypothetical protein
VISLITFSQSYLFFEVISFNPLDTFQTKLEILSNWVLFILKILISSLAKKKKKVNVLKNGMFIEHTKLKTGK